MIVADASVVAELLVAGPQSERIDEVRSFDPEWVAPFHWRGECLNVLWKMLRDERIDRRLAFEAVAHLDGIVSSTILTEARPILELALASKHSPYDCDYVLLARDLGTNFITLDHVVLERFPDVAVSPFAFLQRQRSDDR